MNFLRVSCLLLTCVSMAQAQSRSTAGDVKGAITDPAGASVSGAVVSLTDDSRGISRTVETDREGRYYIAVVMPGKYSLRVEKQGFAARVADEVQVRVGDAVVVNIALEIAANRASVQVNAEAERTQQSLTVAQTAISMLPINRRNFLDFALLSPALAETTSLVDDTNFRPIGSPNSGLSFGGSNGRNNGVYIDGMENLSNSSGVRLSLTQEMVEEFQINRNSYSAEFGNATGGIVNIVSKSGTNQIHGNLFGFLRQRDLQARNYFDPGKAPFTRVQAGATLGGTLKKDKTFFFAGLERLDRHESNIIPLLANRSVLSRLTASQQQLVDFFTGTGNPLLAGLAREAQRALTPANNPRVVQMVNENSGVFPITEGLTLLAARLDHHFSSRHQLFARLNGASNTQGNFSFGALDALNRGRSLEFQEAAIAIGDTFVLSPQWVMETRLMFAYSPSAITPNDPYGPELNIAGFGLFGRQAFLPYKGIERHYQFIQNFSRTAGKHQFKFGYDVNPMRNSFMSATFLSGRFGFGEAIPLATALTAVTGDASLPATLTGLLNGAGRADLVRNLNQPVSALQAFSLGLPASYQQGFGDPNYVNFIKRFHLYLQDQWRVTNALTLNLGLRYENEFHNPIVPADRNNIGPRFGFAWNPQRSGLVIRGGYGLYYGQVTSNVAGTADPLSGRFINQIFIPLAGVAGINNPQTGRPLTPGDIYQTLLRQGVIGSRTIAESDLAQFGLRAAPGLPLSVVFGVSPDLENPWAHQASFEIEKTIGAYTVSAAYQFNRAAHIARVQARNVRYTGERLPDGRPTFARIEPLLLQRNSFESNANSFYHAGVFQISRRWTKSFTMLAHYTWSKAMDEATDFNSDYSPNDQLNARAERALSAFHHAHRFVASGVYEWKNFRIAPMAIANSWRPFNVLTGVDLPSGGDGYANTKRPAHLGRNMGQGPNFVTFDMRLSRTFRLAERLSLEAIGEGFNLANRTNFRTVNNIVGDVPISALPQPIQGNRLGATTPLGFTSALNPRQFQLGLKIQF